VLQRNSTAYPWTWAGDAPHTVLPGETADYPVLLDGWTPVADEAPVPEPGVAKTATKSKRAAAADTEGGGPQ
jgi:hypothetical protein